MSNRGVTTDHLHTAPRGAYTLDKQSLETMAGPTVRATCVNSIPAQGAQLRITDKQNGAPLILEKYENGVSNIVPPPVTNLDTTLPFSYHISTFSGLFVDLFSCVNRVVTNFVLYIV